mmetsp:Transcript_21217/g.52841  ORF Transcript_21217/g.52841 Transcript_21217/m.52841 type:complete len:206 (-) Transcript_21217:17-634(-)
MLWRKNPTRNQRILSLRLLIHRRVVLHSPDLHLVDGELRVTRKAVRAVRRAWGARAACLQVILQPQAKVLRVDLPPERDAIRELLHPIVEVDVVAVITARGEDLRLRRQTEEEAAEPALELWRDAQRSRPEPSEGRPLRVAYHEHARRPSVHAADKAREGHPVARATEQQPPTQPVLRGQGAREHAELRRAKERRGALRQHWEWL